MAPPPGPPGPGPRSPPGGGPGCCALAIAATSKSAAKTTEIFFIGGSPWGLTYDKRDATFRAERAPVFAGRNDAAARGETTLVVSAGRWRGRTLRWRLRRLARLRMIRVLPVRRHAARVGAVRRRLSRLRLMRRIVAAVALRHRVGGRALAAAVHGLLAGMEQ